jgi:hypothetical protein
MFLGRYLAVTIQMNLARGRVFHQLDAWTCGSSISNSISCKELSEVSGWKFVDHQYDILYGVRFRVLTATSLKMTVFRNVDTQHPRT